MVVPIMGTWSTSSFMQDKVSPGSPSYHYFEEHSISYHSYLICFNYIFSIKLTRSDIYKSTPSSANKHALSWAPCQLTFDKWAFVCEAISSHHRIFHELMRDGTTQFRWIIHQALHLVNSDRIHCANFSDNQMSWIKKINNKLEHQKFGFFSSLLIMPLAIDYELKIHL